MDVFEKIEEYEKKVSADIKHKMDLFTHLMLDREIFEKMINNTSSDVSVETNTKEVIDEITSSSSIIELIISNLKEEDNKDSNTQDKAIVRDFKPKPFNSKENGSNLSISIYVNYFDQKQIKHKKLNRQFYHKTSELNLIKIKIAEEYMTQIKKKLYIAFHDSLLNVKQQKMNEDNNSNNNKMKPFNLKKIIEHNIAHLYPSKKAKEDLMNEDFIQEKMIEYHFSGKLSKQVNLKEIMTNYKINEKKKLNDNFNVQMNLTNLLVNHYNEVKALSLTKKKKTHNKKSIEINGISAPKDYFIYTRSMLYVKLNRNRDDIKLSSNKRKEKNQLPHDFK